MYKLVAIDMDETLLNDDAEITPKNVSVLKKAIKDGVKVVLNTGRSYLSVQENLKTLGIYQTKDQYVVSFNGGAIVENKDLKVVHVEGLAFDIVKQLFDISLRYYPESCIHVYTLDELYMWNVNQDEKDYLQPRGVEWTELQELNIDFLKDTPITKIIINVNDMDKRLAFNEIARKEIGDKFKTTYSSGRYIEFNNISTDKGTGMLKLAEMLGIKPEETIAIGDNSNDLPMIEAAGVGVAVRNANEQVLSKADYICKRDNNHDAVAEAVDKFIYNKID